MQTAARVMPQPANLLHFCCISFTSATAPKTPTHGGTWLHGSTLSANKPVLGRDAATRAPPLSVARFIVRRRIVPPPQDQWTEAERHRCAATRRTRKDAPRTSMSARPRLRTISWSTFNSVGRSQGGETRRGPQVGMRFSFSLSSATTMFYAPGGSTHHRGVSDRVARRLPYLRRAPRFEQVLGESPGRFGCHVLIGAVPVRRGGFRRSRSWCLAPEERRASCVYTHTYTHTRTRTIFTHRRVEYACELRLDAVVISLPVVAFEIKCNPGAADRAARLF